MLDGIKTFLNGLGIFGKVLGLTTAAVIGGSVISAAASQSRAPQPVKAPVSTVVQEEKKPKVEVKTVSETTAIPFAKTTVNDGNMNSGTSAIRTNGVNGVKTSTYEVTYTDDKEKSRKLVKEEVTTGPVTEVTAIGTYVYVPPKSNCDPNYSGACVPIASDVDCAGGSGNGPAYVSGPVYVIGIDIYGLDRDGNGVGCE